jgi:hypothetical protein
MARSIHYTDQHERTKDQLVLPDGAQLGPYDADVWFYKIAYRLRQAGAAGTHVDCSWKLANNPPAPSPVWETHAWGVTDRSGQCPGMCTWAAPDQNGDVVCSECGAEPPRDA